VVADVGVGTGVDEQQDVVEVAEVVALLREVAAQVDGLGLRDGDAPGDALAGGSPEAIENRAIRGAKAALAREHAQEMRHDLSAIRVQAEQIAARVRRARAAMSEQQGGGATPVDTREVIRTLAWELAHAQEVDTVQRVLVRRLGDAVPGANRTGLCRRAEARPRGESGAGPVELVAGDPEIAELVAAEDAAGDGPLRVALSGDPEAVHVPDLATASPWPGLAEPARRLGLRGLLVHRLSERHDECAGVLVATTGDPHGFDDGARAALEAVADMAGIALSGARRIEQLARAVQSRDLIGQAKGILMRRDGCSAEDAFAKLVAASQHANMKLADVAAWLVADGVASSAAPTDGEV
jgi:GAF domain-containing protein